MSRAIGCITLLYLSIPFQVGASVVISEVAWMGDDGNANAEWIELYNDGPQVDLSDWTLSAVDGQPDITLEGVLGANSYALLERTSDDTVPAVTAFFVYTGALGNTGEVLELRNSSGVRVDHVDGSDAWSIGGNNDTKETLQRSGDPATGAWVTAVPTPKSSQPVEVEESVGGAVEGAQISKIIGGGNVIDATKNEKVKKVHTEPGLTLALGADRTVIVNTPVTFLAQAFRESGKEIVIENVVWNFGDGVTAKGREVEHTYSHEGDYVVSATGHRDGFLREIKDESRVVVHVVPSSISLVYADKNYTEVQNTGKESANISGYVLLTENSHFTIPSNTFVLPKTSVRFSRKVTGVAGGNGVRLFNPNGVLVSDYSAIPQQTYAVKESTPIVTNYASPRTQEDTKVQESVTLQSEPEIMVQETAVPTIEQVLPANTQSAGLIEGSQGSMWWWVLGLIATIATTILAVLLVRKEQEEVIEGFAVESID